jgi:hypothetical protein
MEFGKPHEHRGPMCALEKSQWCGEPYGVDILQIPLSSNPHSLGTTPIFLGCIKQSGADL